MGVAVTLLEFSEWTIQYFLNFSWAMLLDPHQSSALDPLGGGERGGLQCSPAAKGYDLRSPHMVPPAPYSFAGARKYFQIIYWGMKIWGKFLINGV